MKNKLIFVIIILLFMVVVASQNCPAEETRDPFMDYEIPDKITDEEATLDSLKAKLPFKLSGIIASGGERIAIINVGGETEFIKNAYAKDEFEISHIGESRILIRYHSVKAYMKIGGDLIAADK